MPETCPACMVGHLKPTRSVFVHVYGTTLIHAPHIPAWKCDGCGLIYFDSNAIRQTEVLIGEAGPPPNHYYPSTRLTPSEDGTTDPADDSRPHAESD